MRVSPGLRGTVRIDLDAGERRLLRGLFADTVSLLDGTATAEDTETAGAADEDTAANGQGSEAGVRGLREEFERMMAPGPDNPPEDPALLRLLPQVDADDAERSAEFRRYTEPDLRAAKLSHLRTCLVTLERSGRLSLERAEARSWMLALNDVRLVMAVRMGIETEDDMEELEEAAETLPDSVRLYLSVYDLLTWTQERVVGALAGE